jgi:hypothetical protein
MWYVIVLFINPVLKEVAHVPSEDRGSFLELALRDAKRASVATLLAGLSPLLLFVGSVNDEIVQLFLL